MTFGALNQDIKFLSRIFMGHCRREFTIHTNTSTFNVAKEKESKEYKRKD